MNTSRRRKYYSRGAFSGVSSLTMAEVEDNCSAVTTSGGN
jgi:hypothetical protein